MSAQDDSDAAPAPGPASTDEQASALAAMPDPVVILRADRGPDGQVVDLRYAFLNEAAARIIGKPIEEVLGHGQLELFPSVRELGIWDTFLGVVESGSPASFDAPRSQEDGAKDSLSVTATRFGDGVLVSATDTTEQRKAERALAESGRKYRLLAENASDVVLLTNPERQVTWVSPSVTRTLGWAPEDLLGTRLADLIHPDDQGAAGVARDALYSGHGVPAPTGGVVLRIRTRSGDYRWMSTLGTPVADESGAFAGIVGGWRDVDDLVRAQDEARADRAALRASVDSLLDPQVLYEAARDETERIMDLVFVDANPAACAYFEMARQDLIGAKLLDLFPGHVEAGLFELFGQVVETGEPLVLDDFFYRQELLPAERRYDIRAVRVGDGLAVTWRDVTDRHSAAQRMAESEEQYRLLAENASDVVMRLSPDLCFEWLSGSVAGVLGWESSDLVGRLIDQFIYPEDLDLVRRAVANASGSAAGVEFRFRRADGTHRWVACRTRMKVDEDGTPVAVVGGLVDIAERKALEANELDRMEELERFQRLIVGRELKMIELKKQIDYLRKSVPASGSDPGHQPQS